MRSDFAGDVYVGYAFPNFDAALAIEEYANIRIDLTRLAAALAVYRADHSEYPERLEQLVPKVIPKVPLDLYHAKPLNYQRDAEGYLLYSLGPNGIDDGGSNQQREILVGREIGWNEDDATDALRQQVPAGADDIAIRLPRPPLRLPEPPTPPNAE